MKSPEEIKNGLECCARCCVGEDRGCAYHACGTPVESCIMLLARDARVYIDQLESKSDPVVNSAPKMDCEKVSVKERQTALAFAYQILCEKRNVSKYNMSAIRDINTLECFDYRDMLRVLRVIHAEAVAAQKVGDHQ